MFHARAADRTHSGSLARLLPLLLPLLLLPAPAGAQIVNTLRGFEDQEAGWSGGVEGTVAAADGNTDYFELELDGAVQNLSERHRWRVLGRFMDRRASGTKIAESQLLHLRHNYRVTQPLATIVFAQWTNDPFRRLETRFLVGAGGRLDVLRGESWRGAIGVTYMFEDEEIGPLPDDAPPGTPDDSGSDRDHRWSLFLNLYSGSSETIETDVVAFWQPLVTDLRDARALVIARVRADVTAGLYLLFRYDLTRDTAPPFAVVETDQRLRGGLGFEF